MSDLPHLASSINLVPISRIPEIRALQAVQEHNRWHTDDAYDQTLRLFRWVKKLPGCLPPQIAAPAFVWPDVLTQVLDPLAGHRTVQDLVAFAAAVHDVGKAETYRRLPDGTTQCPDHESVSARMAPAICARFGLSPLETPFVTQLVAAHGKPYALFKEIKSLPSAIQTDSIMRFEIEHAEYLLPLLLLAFGDLFTSHLRIICPADYNAVCSFYQQWLERVLPETEAYFEITEHDQACF